jgi:hypothetical protein
MVLTLQKPVSAKRTTPTGETEAYHTFGFETDMVLIGVATQTPAEALVALLAKDGLTLQAFLTDFLRLSTQYFAKPYTVANVLKTLKHDVVPSTASGSVSFRPKEIQISSKGFLVRWSCTQNEEATPLISLPDMEEEALEGDEIDAIPLSNSNEVIQLQPPNIRHIYDRQKVKEANLRAKLAQFKANRAHLEYLEKYGEDPSDSDDSDSDESDDSQ